MPDIEYLTERLAMAQAELARRDQQEMDLHYALEQADGGRHDVETMLRAEKARVRELETALAEERYHVAALEHALAGASWALTEAGIDVTGGEVS